MTLYLFDAFELDDEAAELRRAGRPLVLQPRVFETLSYLVRHAGRVVSRDELIDALWDGQQLNDNAVPWSVSHVRRALAQSGRQRRPIETVRGKGYRFVAEVRTVSRPPPPVARPAREAWVRAAGAPFVGRAAVMSQLEAALDAARAGRGRLCLLTGEAGIGKTRCAGELAAQATRQQLGVLSGRCVAAPAAPALWPWIQVLRAAAGSDDTPEPLRAEASALLTELVPSGTAQDDVTRALTKPVPEGGDFWLIDGLQRWLLSLAANNTQVIVVDDLHSADTRSLQVLSLLAPALAGTRMLVLGTVRDALDTDLPREVADALQRVRPAQRIALTALSELDVAQYLEGAMGKPPPLELTRAVREKTAGNPLFLGEAVGLLTAELAAGRSAAAGDVKLPEIARGYLLERVRRLDPATRATLEVASVIGDEVGFGLLQVATEAEAGALLAQLDAAIAARFLVRTHSANAFAFGHALLRAAVYDELPLSRRIELHARVVVALEQAPSDQAPPSALAYHAQGALPALGHERAVRYCAQAGAAAMRVYAYDDAVRFYDWALTAAEHAPAPSAHTLAALMVGRAAALLAAGRHTDSHAAARRAIELARAHAFTDVLLAATRLLRPSLLLAQQPDPQLLEALEEALAGLPPDADAARAQAHARLALLPPYSLSIEKSGAMSETAVRLARQSGDRLVLQGALRSRFHALSGPDHIDELLEVTDELLRLDTRGGSWWSAEAHLARYLSLCMRGDIPNADRELDAYGRTVKHLRLPGVQWDHERLCAQRLLQSGELDRAERRFEELWSEAERLSLTYAAAYYMAQRYALRLERQGTKVPLDRTTAAQNDDAFRFARPFTAYRSLAVLQSIGGRDSTGARRELWDLLKDDCSGITRDGRFLGTMVRMALAAIDLEDRAAAELLYRLLAPYAAFNALTSSELWLGSVAHHLGALARFLGQLADAERHMEQALAMNERIGYRTQALRSQLLLASVLRHSSTAAKQKRAVELAASARTQAHELGLPSLAERAGRRG